MLRGCSDCSLAQIDIETDPAIISRTPLQVINYDKGGANDDRKINLQAFFPRDKIESVELLLNNDQSAVEVPVILGIG